MGALPVSVFLYDCIYLPEENNIIITYFPNQFQHCVFIVHIFVLFHLTVIYRRLP